MAFYLSLLVFVFDRFREWRPEGWNAEEVWAFPASRWALPRLSLHPALHGENILLLSTIILYSAQAKQERGLYKIIRLPQMGCQIKSPGYSTHCMCLDFAFISNTFICLKCFWGFFYCFFIHILTAPLHFCLASNLLFPQTSSNLLESKKSFVSSGSVNLSKSKKSYRGCSKMKKKKWLYAERLLDKVDERGLRVLRSGRWARA